MSGDAFGVSVDHLPQTRCTNLHKNTTTMYKLSKTRQNKIRIAQREEVRNAFAKAERRIIDWNRWHNRNDGSGTVVGWLERVEIIEELALTLLSKCDAYRTVWEEHKER